MPKTCYLAPTLLPLGVFGCLLKDVLSLFLMHVLITGASGALGRVVVQQTLSAGYHVTACSRDSLDIRHDALRTVSIDLTNSSHIEALIADHPPLTGAFLLAGGFLMNDLLATTADQLLQQLQLNFFTAYNVARPVLRHMLPQGKGHIICIGARPALDPAQGAFAAGYTLSKSLLLPLVDLLNAQGASQGVRSSLVVPSIIDTAANRTAMPDADSAQWVTPEQIADALLLLLDSKTSGWRNTVLKLYANA